MSLQDYIEFDKPSNTLICRGNWNLENIAELLSVINRKNIPAKDEIIVDGKQITKLDSAGALLLATGIKASTGRTVNINYESFTDKQQKILNLIRHNQPLTEQNIPRETQLNPVQMIGRYGLTLAREMHEFINFIGELFIASLYGILNISQWRWRAIISVINRTGAEALPIIALLSFSIGVVISYQMGDELRKYGANVFIVDLLGLSVLREFGPLLTAIMVGGRTGSSFTAQIGIMKINQEIDALTSMGVKPSNILLLPRIAGLLIVLPLVTVWADIFGVIGGMAMANYMFGISWYDFMMRFQTEVPLRCLLIGIGKAPIFALIIACCGCFEGMKVRGSAESVGIRTTRSVVTAIFFIISFDGIVAVILSRYGL